MEGEVPMAIGRFCDDIEYVRCAGRADGEASSESDEVALWNEGGEGVIGGGSGLFGVLGIGIGAVGGD